MAKMRLATTRPERMKTGQVKKVTSTLKDNSIIAESSGSHTTEPESKPGKLPWAADVVQETFELEQPSPKIARSKSVLPHESRAFRPVMVAGIGGAPLPAEQELDDDREHGPMRIE